MSAEDRGSSYQIVVAGHLDDHWSAWLGGLSLVRNDDSTTTMTLRTADQAQLYGVLAGLRDVGAELLCLRRIDDALPVPVASG